MTAEVENVLKRIASQAPTPVYRQLRELAEDSGTKIRAPRQPETASEVSSVWSIRLWNSVIKGRRFTGLRDLVRNLNTLAPDAPVHQIAFLGTHRTGIVFTTGTDHAVVGAVIASSRNEEDERRALANWRDANRLQAPAFLTAARSR
jgi:hypothetical protein